MTINTGIVSRGEIVFGKWYRKTIRDNLMPDDDWYSPKYNILFEVKDIQFPRSHFEKGYMRVNKVSLQRHQAIKNKYKEIFVVLTFSDGTMLISDIDSVMKTMTQDKFNMTSDRATGVIQLNVFKGADSLKEILK